MNWSFALIMLIGSLMFIEAQNCAGEKIRPGLSSNPKNEGPKAKAGSHLKNQEPITYSNTGGAVGMALSVAMNDPVIK